MVTLIPFRSASMERRRFQWLMVFIISCLLALMFMFRQSSARQPPDGSPRFRVGDHIYIHRGGYDHHGLVYETDASGAGIITKVAHIASDAGDLGNRAMNSFQVSGVERFQFGNSYQAIKRMRYGAKWSESISDVHASPLLPDYPEVILARMRWLLRHRDQGLSQYDLVGQNCEHAAHWCRTGQQWSRQSLVLQRDAAPFNPSEDRKLAIEVARLRRAALQRLPRQGDVVRLTLEANGAALDWSDTGSSQMEFAPTGSELFRVHSAFVDAAGDDRHHAVFGFESLSQGCFLSESKGKLVCSSSEFGPQEWFVVHGFGAIQHFQTGNFLASAHDGACFVRGEEDAAIIGWPWSVRLRAWRFEAQANFWYIVAGFVALGFVAWAWVQTHAIEPILHIVFTILLLGSCAVLWLNGETVAFAVLFLASGSGLLVQMRSAPQQIVPAFAVLTCMLLGGAILWRARVREEPLFTAIAQALIVCVLVLAAVDLVRATLSPRLRSLGHTSRALALITVPILVATWFATSTAAHAIPRTALVFRASTILVGAGRVAFVGRMGPRSAASSKPMAVVVPDTV